VEESALPAREAVPPRLGLTFLLIGLALPHATAAEGPTDHPAVPLRHPPLVTPAETAGTGLAPEVTVRVHLDTRGRVDSVRILKVRPASEYDALLETVVVETLSRWRYAPEIRDGKPVGTELEWTIQFQPLEERDEDEPTVSYSPGQQSQDERQDLWKKILGLSRKRRIEMLERIAGLAKKQLNPKTQKRFASPRFVVYTDSRQENLAQVVAGNLEATYGIVHDLLHPTIAPQAESYKVIAFMYSSKSSFEKLKRGVPAVEWAVGFYNPAGMIAFHQEMPTSESLVSTMLHEATHAFVDRHVSRRGNVLPRWLGEGFAEYIGNSAIRKGELIPGRTQKSQIYHTPAGMFMGRSEEAFSVDQVRTAMRKGKALTIEKIVSADPRTFYGSESQMYYTMSWLLVHYLRHGERSWEEKEFPTFFLYVAEGYPVRESFEAVYGRTPSSLEGSFRTYVKRF